MVRKEGERKDRIKHVDEGTSGFLTVAEVARMLNVHSNTVRTWSNIGILKSFRIGPRGDRRFKKEDIDKFLYK